MRWYFWSSLSLVLGCVIPKALRKSIHSIEVCEEKECIEAANHILKWMNPAFDPCEDFYEFTCGYWHSPDNKTINKQHKQSLEFSADIVHKYLRMFMMDKSVVYESPLNTALIKFVNLCLDEGLIKREGVNPAIKVLQKSGSWPVLEPSWTGKKFDLIETQINLDGSLLHVGLSMREEFIRLKILGPEFPDFPSKMELVDGLQNDSIQKYFKKMCDVAEAFGATRGYAEQELKESLAFEIALAELSSSTNESWEDEVGYNISTLQTRISWVNWTRLITGVLPKTVIIKDDDVISVPTPELLKKLGPLISTFPEKVVANYVMWKAAYSMLPYLPHELARTVSSSNDTRYDHCANVVKGSSFAPLIASYIGKRMTEVIKTASEIADQIKHQLILEIQEMSWLDTNSRNEAISKISDTKTNVSFPQELLDLKQLEAFYREIKTTFPSYFDAAMYMHHWSSKQKFELIGHPMDDTFIYKVWEGLGIKAHFTFDVVVSPGMLYILPLLNSKLPSYINYGHFGGILAHELIHAIDVKMNYYPSKNYTGSYVAEWLMKHDRDFEPAYKDLLNRFPNNSTKEKQKYEEKEKCLIDQYSSFNDTKTTKMKLDGRRTVFENTADIGGLKLAFKTYRRVAAQMSAPKAILPRLEQYTPEQLFMISAANTYCVISDYKQHFRDLKFNSHSPWEFRVKGMMINSLDFGQIFQCEKGEPMNPSDKCEVW